MEPDSFESDDFDTRLAYTLMDGAARAAGWDDPAEDLYDDLVRKEPDDKHTPL